MARWALISGPKKSDRTGQALALANRLKELGVHPGGFVQLKRFTERGKKAYDLLRLRTGEQIQLAQELIVASETDGVTTCSVKFDPAIFERAYCWLKEDSQIADVLFVGDISKVEISGDGHAQSVRLALSLSDQKLAVLCVRADQLFDVVERFGLEDDVTAALELPANEATCLKFRENLVEAIVDAERMTR